MSEIKENPKNNKRSRTIILIAVISVLMLLLIYGAGTIALPMSILSSYHAKNCDSVSSLSGIYNSIYPGFIQDRTIYTSVEECAAYTLARSKEQDENWRGAYDAYQAYSKTYPDGLYVGDTYEQSAVVLMSLAKEQAEKKDYADALTNLNLIISDYPDTGVSKDALLFVPSVYTSWSADLREAESFDIAERVINDFRSWAQNHQKPELEKDALDELAQTYLDWGMDLQLQKEFDAALVKFDMAANLDQGLSPETVAEAKSNQRRLYVEWGNDLLEQDQFSAAIETFRFGVSRSDGDNEDGVNDALVNGYIQWAGEYSADEDFEGALEHLETAGQTALLSETMRKSLDTALEDTYLDFSQSTGDQARRAMRAALISVCDKHKEPDLPIFGLNKESIRFGIYGVDAQLPDEVAAKTPGEMHYIACVTEGNNTVDSRSYREIVLRTSTGYYYRIVQQYRAELLWNFEILNTNTLDVIDTKTFTGGTPPPFPNTGGGTYFYGSPPEMEDIVEWLESVAE